MDRKTRSKSILKMMILIILILIQVQATDLASISFHRTLVSISVPNFSKIYNKHGLFYVCITAGLQGCLQILIEKGDIEKYGMCEIQSFQHCMSNLLYVNSRDYYGASRCKHDCNEEKLRFYKHYADCLKNCHEKFHREHL